MSFQSELVTACKAELIRFDGRDETDPTVFDILMEYWMEGAGFSKPAARKAIRKRTAWSAAFISFVVKKALKESRSRAAFAFNGSHSVYIGAAIRNDFNAARPPAFFGVPPRGVGAEKVQVGDIFGATRALSIPDYEAALRAARNKDTYFSHCDVAIEVGGGTVTSIGGNVSNSVTQRTVALDNDGFLPVRPFKKDDAGQVVSGPFICVIKERET